ncbi:MAG: FmdB family zinc ribbon protein [Brevefilum sp.]
MPIYEYTCQDCQTNFEIIRRMQDADAPLTCEHCQGTYVKRGISLFNASSSGRVIAGGSSCSSCSSGACSTCGSH